MSNIEMLVKEIENFPPVYQQEILNFVDHLKSRQRNQISMEEDEAYRAMAADSEREKEAGEWCNAYFGPTGKAQ
jgi:hypothetical protein